MKLSRAQSGDSLQIAEFKRIIERLSNQLKDYKKENFNLLNENETLQIKYNSSRKGYESEMIKMNEDIKQLRDKVQELLGHRHFDTDVNIVENQTMMGANIKYQPEIKVERILPITDVKIIYEKDETLKTRNEELNGELEISQLECQTVKLKLANSEQLNSLLKKKIEEQNLLMSVPRVVYQPKEVIVEKFVNPKLGEKLDFLISFHTKYSTTPMVKQLMLALLHYHSLFMIYFNKFLKCEQLNKNFEENYLKKLHYIYTKVVSKLVNYLNETFQASIKAASRTGQKSLIIFEKKIENLKETQDETLYSMLAIYKEFAEILEDSGYLATASEAEMRKGNDFLFKEVGQASGELNNWIEDSLVYINNRETYDQGNNRFYGIRHRILEPLEGKPLSCEKHLFEKLERAISNKAVQYFEPK